jgi:hypothetical protein
MGSLKKAAVTFSTDEFSVKKRENDLAKTHVNLLFEINRRN